jgi:small multidrug resistance family-3 protein
VSWRPLVSTQPERRDPDRWDIIGATICLAGVGVIMYAPR